MSALGGRRLRPIVIVAALVMLLWGAGSVVALVARLVNVADVGWPPVGTWVWTGEWLIVAASAVGSLAVLWGALALLRRPPLHAGAATVIVSLALEIASIVLDRARGGVSLTDSARIYWHGAIGDLAAAGFPAWRSVAPSWPLLLGWLPLLLWLVVLVSGAGRRRPVAWPTTVATAATAEAAGVAPGLDSGRDSGLDSGLDSGETAEASGEVESVEAGSQGAASVERADPAGADVQTAGAEEAAGGSPEEGSIPDGARVWFVTVRGADHGPYTRTQLRGYLAEGRLHDGTLTHLADGEVQRLVDVVA